jgi:hypothetical protein
MTPDRDAHRPTGATEAGDGAAADAPTIGPQKARQSSGNPMPARVLMISLALTVLGFTIVYFAFL